MWASGGGNRTKQRFSSDFSPGLQHSVNVHVAAAQDTVVGSPAAVDIRPPLPQLLVVS